MENKLHLPNHQPEMYGNPPLFVYGIGNKSIGILQNILGIK
jgi:hypothetical protein